MNERARRYGTTEELLTAARAEAQAQWERVIGRAWTNTDTLNVLGEVQRKIGDRQREAHRVLRLLVEAHLALDAFLAAPTPIGSTPCPEEEVLHEADSYLRKEAPELAELFTSIGPLEPLPPRPSENWSPRQHLVSAVDFGRLRDSWFPVKRAPNGWPLELTRRLTDRELALLSLTIGNMPSVASRDTVAAVIVTETKFLNKTRGDMKRWREKHIRAAQEQRIQELTERSQDE